MNASAVSPLHNSGVGKRRAATKRASSASTSATATFVRATSRPLNKRLRCTEPRRNNVQAHRDSVRVRTLANADWTNHGVSWRFARACVTVPATTAAKPQNSQARIVPQIRTGASGSVLRRWATSRQIGSAIARIAIARRPNRTTGAAPSVRAMRGPVADTSHRVPIHTIPKSAKKASRIKPIERHLTL